jgi:Tol biopolymer transport system component
MTTPSRIERNLPGILGDLSAAPTPDYLDDVFARTGRTRQRPGWTFPERWLPMADIARARAFAPAPPWRFLATALVVLALIIVAALIYAGSQRHRVPAPFGPARNGLIPYEKGGDIYVGDPVNGVSRLVVGGSATDSDPAYSPDGMLIAFVRDAGNLQHDVYVIQPDGSGLRRVTRGPLDELNSVFWAPDSQHIGAVSAIGNKNRLRLFDTTGEGKAVELAANLQPDNVVFRPPEGREIAFRATVNERLGLYVMNADGTNLRALVEPAVPAEMNLHLAGLTYTADGNHILYQRGVTATADHEGGCCELWIMNADGTDQHRFDPLAEPGQAGVPGTSWSGEAVVSPDGQWIAYWHVFNDRPTQRVSIVRADGNGPVIQVGPELNGTASWVWSPDSTRLLLVPVEGTDAPRQYLIDPVGGTVSPAPWNGTSLPNWQRLALD